MKNRHWLKKKTNVDLSKYLYEVIREVLKNSGFDILPPYKKILGAKKRTLSLRNTKIIETKAEIDFQYLLDHIVKKIFKGFDKERVSNIEEELVLISKWGCDKAAGKNGFKQNFSENSKMY